MKTRFEVVSGVEQVDRRLWNEMAGSAAPTMEWEYFYCLEKSNTVGANRGYHPRHVVAYQQGHPVAIAPLYERDRAWVEFGDGGLIQFLSEITGLPYHLGLVATVPLTPVPGYQFLCRPQMDASRLFKALLDYIDFICETRDLGTSRLYFLADEMHSPLHNLMLQQGYIGLRSEYFLWFNKGYEQFEDFLGEFKSSRRRKIKRELRSIRDDGIRLRMIQGTQAGAKAYGDMYDLYRRTWIKHMGSRIEPFLNRSFFELLGRHFPHRCRFDMATRDEEPLAMALFYHKDNRLYGRYWGCYEDVPFLHFATCYYHPIRHAIEQGIETVDPGFGGEHKLYRGFKVVSASHYVKFHGEERSRLAHAILQRMRATPRVVTRSR